MTEPAAESTAAFRYAQAFDRNVGWVTATEQKRLRQAKVAIAGLGGVGGSHLTTLARMGVGRFHIADFDEFQIQNFNRQAGAFMSTIGQPKADVLARIALDINPMLELQVFKEGVTPENLNAFLDGVDVYVDGIDFFAIEARRMIFEECGRRGIPALTAAPLGMGVAFLRFEPGRMSFEQYFRLEGQSRDEQLVRFIAGLSPAMLQRGYLVRPKRVDFSRQAGPSTPMACDLCAGVMGTEVLKQILGRGRRPAAPLALQYDAFRQKFSTTWRPGGNANPMQRALIALIRRQLFSGGKPGD